MNELRLLHTAMFTPSVGGKLGLPLILIGDPGTAKTSLIVREAVESGLHVEVLIASLCDPTDVQGLMFAGANVTEVRSASDLTGQGDGVTYIPPAWAVRAARAGRSLILIDEINSCNGAMQAALNRITLERVVGGFELPPTVRIMAARNKIEHASGGYEMSAALDNRFGQLPWRGPDFASWRNYIASGRQKSELVKLRNAEEEENRVSEAWDREYAVAAGLVLSFLEKHQSMWKAEPVAGAFASMRTWDMAINALTGARIHGLTEDETDTFLAAFVGESPVIEFRAWLAAMDLPNPASLLDGEVTFTPDPDRIDMTMVVLMSCATLVAPKEAEKREARAKACWALIKSNLVNADVCYPAAMVLSSEKVKLVRGYPDATAVMARFAPMMAAAGMI